MWYWKNFLTEQERSMMCRADTVLLLPERAVKPGGWKWDDGVGHWKDGEVCGFVG